MASLARHVAPQPSSRRRPCAIRSQEGATLAPSQSPALGSRRAVAHLHQVGTQAHCGRGIEAGCRGGAALGSQLCSGQAVGAGTGSWSQPVTPRLLAQPLRHAGVRLQRPVGAGPADHGSPTAPSGSGTRAEAREHLVDGSWSAALQSSTAGSCGSF